MPQSIDPTKARILRDVKNYRSKIKNDPRVAQEIIGHLKEKDDKYKNAKPADVVKPDAYLDFASFQGKGKDSKKANLPNRLGGALDDQVPRHLPPPPPIPDETVEWTTKHGDDIEVEVRADGAIVHKDDDGNEIPEAHEYMHGIFDTILYETRRLLELINTALQAYADKYSEDDPAQTEAGAYLGAVTAFNEYYASLQPNGKSPYAGAFTFVGIDPVVTNEGFIVSCRVKLNWKNPYHSSSTIKVP